MSTPENRKSSKERSPTDSFVSFNAPIAHPENNCTFDYLFSLQFLYSSLIFFTPLLKV